jgi:transcriptional regulator with XRE-family HTH domain
MRTSGRPFAEFVHEQMRLRDWNQSEFAQAVEVDHSVVSRWLTGDRTPSAAMVLHMAQTLGVDEDELLQCAGYRQGPPRELSPQQADLIAKIRQIRWTRDRYLAVDALLENLRQRDPGWTERPIDGPANSSRHPGDLEPSRQEWGS